MKMPDDPVPTREYPLKIVSGFANQSHSCLIGENEALSCRWPILGCHHGRHFSRNWHNGTGPTNYSERIAEALEAAFTRCAINRSRIAIGGFSDGASYALSLGLANGDLFNNIVAFSPGYIVRAPGRGRPSLFIAHGSNDPVLPIATTSRIFIASLRKNGYNVDFREFSGGHNVPSAVAEQAMEWLVRRFCQR
jgi:predicted esterase